MKIKGAINVDLSKPQLQALYMAAKLELERYKGITLSDLTEQVKALNDGKDKIWGWINFSEVSDKEFINRMEWESLLFSAQIELRRYKELFEVRQLRGDLQDLDEAVMEISPALMQSKKVKA